MNDIILNEEKGEIICPKCNGSGCTDKELYMKGLKNAKVRVRDCPKCNGEGKLDWIENIIGKVDKKILNVDIIYTPPKSIERIKMDIIIK